MLSVGTDRDFHRSYCLANLGNMAQWRQRVEQRRKLLGITQEELSERIGVTLGAYGHWIHGRREPDLETFDALAAELQCPVSWLVYGVEASDNPKTRHLLEVMEQLPDYKQDILVNVADGLAKPDTPPQKRRVSNSN